DQSRFPLKFEMNGAGNLNPAGTNHLNATRRDTVVNSSLRLSGIRRARHISSSCTSLDDATRSTSKLLTLKPCAVRPSAMQLRLASSDTISSLSLTFVSQ